MRGMQTAAGERTGSQRASDDRIWFPPPPGLSLQWSTTTHRTCFSQMRACSAFTSGRKDQDP
eukprot:scaffold494_cov245-Pinguiococcus_pyrenoidosus.AAC.19